MGPKEIMCSLISSPYFSLSLGPYVLFLSTAFCALIVFLSSEQPPLLSSQMLISMLKPNLKFS